MSFYQREKRWETRHTCFVSIWFNNRPYESQEKASHAVINVGVMSMKKTPKASTCQSKFGIKSWGSDNSSLRDEIKQQQVVVMKPQQRFGRPRRDKDICPVWTTNLPTQSSEAQKENGKIISGVYCFVAPVFSFGLCLVFVGLFVLLSVSTSGSRLWFSRSSPWLSKQNTFSFRSHFILLPIHCYHTFAFLSNGWWRSCRPVCCHRYEAPECDSAARSRSSDVEDPFQGRELPGCINFNFSLRRSPEMDWSYLKTQLPFA